jgi:hypothetical protein
MIRRFFLFSIIFFETLTYRTQQSTTQYFKIKVTRLEDQNVSFGTLQQTKTKFYKTPGKDSIKLNFKNYKNAYFGSQGFSIEYTWLTISEFPSNLVNEQKTTTYLNFSEGNRQIIRNIIQSTIIIELDEKKTPKTIQIAIEQDNYQIKILDNFSSLKVYSGATFSMIIITSIFLAVFCTLSKYEYYEVSDKNLPLLGILGCFTLTTTAMHFLARYPTMYPIYSMFYPILFIFSYNQKTTISVPYFSPILKNTYLCICLATNVAFYFFIEFIPYSVLIIYAGVIIDQILTENSKMMIPGILIPLPIELSFWYCYYTEFNFWGYSVDDKPGFWFLGVMGLAKAVVVLNEMFFLVNDWEGRVLENFLLAKKELAVMDLGSRVFGRGEERKGSEWEKKEKEREARRVRLAVGSKRLMAVINEEESRQKLKG